MLDIIVPHCGEPWEIGKPFFDMLACQRGVDFNDFRVLLIHDGAELLPDECFVEYPYRVEQHRIAHSGVSAARNFGLDLATAKWVCFCDFDDRFTYIYALRGIMAQMENDIDYMWTPFFIEVMSKGDLGVKIEEENIVWVHGKFFRRKFLNENQIRFPEGIHYSEDSAFCAVVNELAATGRRGRIKLDFPAYSWVFRGDSVSMAKENFVKNTVGFIDRNFYVVEEFKRRGLNHIPIVGRMFADAYWCFHQKAVHLDEHEERFAVLCIPYMDDLIKNDRDTFIKILQSARVTFKGKEMDTSESFGAWLDRLKEMGECSNTGSTQT